MRHGERLIRALSRAPNCAASSTGAVRHGGRARFARVAESQSCNSATKSLVTPITANRARSLYYDGEIYELYLRPEFQGLGFGRRLFTAARRDLAQSALKSLI